MIQIPYDLSSLENGPTQRQRKTLTRVGFEPTTFGFWSTLLHQDVPQLREERKQDVGIIYLIWKTS